ncbi:hypothetical protein DV737_g2033, partial [Chaetothyriales sp. CBS 132003]
MAPLYAAVSQTDDDAPYANVKTAHSKNDAASPDLAQVVVHRPLSTDFESLTGEVAVVGHTAGDDVTPTPKPPRAVGGFLNSLSSGHSYDMIEQDDYDEPQPPLATLHSDPDASNVAARSCPRVRTASVPRHLPLNHPIPDLQSVQGAYAKHVERLEEGAERLSMTSSLDEGIRQIKAEQRAEERRAEERRSSGASSHSSSVRRTVPACQFSGLSLSNSIIGVNSTARTGGYSPAAYVTSPTGSIRSGSGGVRADSQARSSKSSKLSSQLPEPGYEASQLTSGEQQPARVLPGLAAYQSEMGVGVLAVTNGSGSGTGGEHGSRPASPPDVEGEDPFADFDGVHHSRASLDPDGSSLRRISMPHPPLARDSRAFREAQPGESMVYYPAPVPVMLNLPTRLSKMSISEREKRRLQALSGVPEDLRKSAAWLKDMPANSNPSEGDGKLPPQLRASAFFDGPSTSMNLRLTDGSAVQTLDTILDASAHAPVSVFTDHPIAGKVGSEVYGSERHSRKSSQGTRISVQKTRRRSSMGTLLRLRRSSDALADARHSRITSRESNAQGIDEEEEPRSELEQAAAESIAPDDDELVHDGDDKDEGGDEDAESTESEHRPGFSVAPTTLLAELQMRKAHLKMRNRTAADAFPQGMHSTLLELDAVAQLQQKARRTKHVTLAWEDQKAADQENFGDEDIPLGVLFPDKGKASLLNANRPLGLMEKREQEENEPLSFRRARLRGEPYQPPPSRIEPGPTGLVDEASESKFKLELPGSQGIEEEKEGETLAQRRKRMQEGKERSTADNFASQVASELGLEEDKSPAPSKTPDAEETLGQRRKRLKEEALKAGRNPGGNSLGAPQPGLRTSHSMADILQAYPNGLRQASGGSAQSQPQQALATTAFAPNQSQVDMRGSAMPQIPAHMQGLPYYNQISLMQPQYNASQGLMYGYNALQQMATPMAMNGMQYGQYGQYGMVPNLIGPPLTTQQRAVIDRWRQGVA